MVARAKPSAPSLSATDGEGLASRAAALELLSAAVAQRGGLEQAMARPPFAGLELRERAFARALAATTLRRLGQLDRLMQPRLQTRPPEPVRWLLRIGAAQLLFMDVPAHAAVATTVEQAGASPPLQRFKGLVNAVLRAIARDGAPPLEPQALAPDWLLARWRVAHGEATALAIAAAIAEEPATDLTLRSQAEAERLQPLLEAELLAGGGLRTHRRGDVVEWPGYDEGAWWVQDASAALPVRLLDPRPGEAALDLCAAPGGKTLQLAAAGARVTALDRSALRLSRLSANLERCGLQAQAVVAEAAAWPDARQFDAVLLDAPCSATGTFRRHPDVLWAARPADVGKLAVVQHRLLDAAAERVRPGGRLLYCTCSLEREEGEDQAAAFLARRPDFATLPIAAGEAGAPGRAVTAQGWLRLLPGSAEPGLGGDGFFVSRFARSGA